MVDITLNGSDLCIVFFISLALIFFGIYNLIYKKGRTKTGIASFVIGLIILIAAIYIFMYALLLASGF